MLLDNQWIKEKKYYKIFIQKLKIEEKHNQTYEMK